MTTQNRQKSNAKKNYQQSGGYGDESKQCLCIMVVWDLYTRIAFQLIVNMNEFEPSLCSVQHEYIPNDLRQFIYPVVNVRTSSSRFHPIATIVNTNTLDTTNCFFQFKIYIKHYDIANGLRLEIKMSKTVRYCIVRQYQTSMCLLCSSLCFELVSDFFEAFVAVIF